VEEKKREKVCFHVIIWCDSRRIQSRRASNLRKIPIEKHWKKWDEEKSCSPCCTPNQKFQPTEQHLYCVLLWSSDA